MSEQKFDVVVIGTGPGGEGAAMQAAKGGKRTAVIEAYKQIGGGCTHWGTIPSKALRFSIYSAMEAMNNPIIRDMGIQVNPSFAQLRASSKSIITKQVSMRQTFYERNNVPVFAGQARFIDPHTIEVDEDIRIRGEHIIIATGSRPYRPNGVDFSHPRVFDSDTILDLSFKPQSIAIYGAGVIGCEYASMFRNLSIKVNLINTRSKLLEFLDEEIIDALSYQMRESGVILRHNETFSKIEPRDDGVVLSLESGKQVKSDILLWANGRSGNTEMLELQNIGIAPNSRGYIDVNQSFQTACPNVYAVGDVIGFCIKVGILTKSREFKQFFNGGKRLVCLPISNDVMRHCITVKVREILRWNTNLRHNRYSFCTLWQHRSNTRACAMAYRH
jgi:NAD(P) transhydrogenase